VPGRGGSRGEETVAGEGRALFSFDPGCGRGGRYNNLVLTREQNREVFALAARPRLAENSRQGVPTSTQTLYRGFEFAISSTYMGLQFRCSETVSGTVVAPNNLLERYFKAVSCNLKAEAAEAKKGGVALSLDAAGFIPGEGVVNLVGQTGIGMVSATISANNNDVFGVQSATAGVGLTFAGTFFKSGVAKAIPFLGWGVNTLATLHDLQDTISTGSEAYNACMSQPQ